MICAGEAAPLLRLGPCARVYPGVDETTIVMARAAARTRVDESASASEAPRAGPNATSGNLNVRGEATSLASFPQ